MLEQKLSKPLIVIFATFALVPTSPTPAFDRTVNKLVDEAISAEVEDNFLKAELLYSQALKVANKMKASPAETVCLQCHLMRVQLSERKAPEAEMMFRRTMDLAFTVKHQDPCFNEMVEALLDLAVTYEQFGKDTKSFVFYQHALLIHQKFMPKVHPRIGRLLFKIGRYHLEKGEPKEAVSYLEQSVGEYKKGPFSQDDILHPILALVAAQVKMGNQSEAKLLLKQWVPVARRAWGMYMVGTAELLYYAGKMKRLDRHYPKAEKLLKEAFAVAESVKDHTLAGRCLTELAILYCDQGLFPLAEVTFNKAIGMLTASKERFHLFMAWSGLGQLYLMKKNYPKCEQAYREALRIGYRYKASPELCHAMNGLAQALRQQGKLPESMKLTREAQH